eukprot:2237767-Rhodomonas_salina.2
MVPTRVLWIAFVAVSLIGRDSERGGGSCVIFAEQKLPDAHTYRDGWVIRNVQQEKVESGLQIEVSQAGTLRAAFFLLVSSTIWRCRCSAMSFSDIACGGTRKWAKTASQLAC